MGHLPGADASLGSTFHTTITKAIEFTPSVGGTATSWHFQTSVPLMPHENKGQTKRLQAPIAWEFSLELSTAIVSGLQTLLKRVSQYVMLTVRNAFPGRGVFQPGFRKCLHTDCSFS